MASANMQRVLANLYTDASSGTVTQKILSWIVFFLLIVVIAYVLYFVYSSIFKGYSRSFFDIIQLNFSNKVDVAREFGDKNGILSNALWYLANNADNDIKFIRDKKLVADNVFQVIGKCTGDNCDNVFKNFLEVINQYYEPEYKHNKEQQALIDYVAYHDKLSNDLGLKKLKTEERITKLEYILDGVINYMNIYANIITKENNIVCARNDQKGFEKRDAYNKNIKAAKDELKRYIRDYGITAISTNMQFANFFTDPWFVANCGTFFTSIYTELLSKTSHNADINSIKKINEQIAEAKQKLAKATTQEEKKEHMQTIKTNKEDKLKLEIKMARIRKQVTQQAIDIKNNESKENAINIKASVQDRSNEAKKFFEKRGREIKNIKDKFNKKKKQQQTQQPTQQVVAKVVDVTELKFNESATYTNIIRYEGDNSNNTVATGNLYPLTVPRSDGMYNKIYVPCYEAYMHFVNLNIHRPVFKSFLDKGMGKDEIVAYLFMKDIALLQNEIQENTQPFIVRILKMYLALENVTFSIRSIIDTGKTENKNISIGAVLRNILVDNGDVVVAMKTDVEKHKETLHNAYKQDMFDRIDIKTNNTWKLMELLFMAETNVGNQFDVIFNRFHANTNVSKNADLIKLAQRINTYMNLGTSVNIVKRKDTTLFSQDAISKIVTALNIDSKTQKFIIHYPMFSTIYFSSIASAKSAKQTDVNDAQNAARELYIKTCELMQVLPNIDILGDNFDVQYTNFIDSVNSLKLFVLNAHMVYMYMMQYRHVVVEKDNTNGTRYERNGYVELYNDQFMGDKEFYSRLITPFKKDLIDNRVASAWKRTFQKTFFSKVSKQSYWIEFNALWIDTLRPKADKMIKDVWRDVGKSARLRW